MLLPIGSVAAQRSKYMSTFTTSKWNTYPSPGNAVLFDPLMGRDNAAALIKVLVVLVVVSQGTNTLLSIMNFHPQ